MFLEVQTRSFDETDLSEDVITKENPQRAGRIAINYLKSHDVEDMVVRFDAISLLIVESDKAFLRHHVNIFAVGD